MLLRLRSMLAPAGEMLFGSMLHAQAESSEYLRFVPDSYAGDATWWFVPGRLAMRWMLEVCGFSARELILSEGPRGEFRTMNGYFLATPGEIAPELGSHATDAKASDQPPQRFAPRPSTRRCTTLVSSRGAVSRSGPGSGAQRRTSTGGTRIGEARAGGARLPRAARPGRGRTDGTRPSTGRSTTSIRRSTPGFWLGS